MSYPIHGLIRGASSRSVRTETGFWGFDPLRNAADRSPDRASDTVNLIWKGSVLARRPGYRAVCTLKDPIYGIYFYKKELLVHAGGCMYRIATEGAEPKMLAWGLARNPSRGVIRTQRLTRRWLTEAHCGGWHRETTEQTVLFFSDGKDYWFYDGVDFRTVGDNYWNVHLDDAMDGTDLVPEFFATVPFTAVAKLPSERGGDVDPRGSNRLSQFCCESFFVDESGSAEFALNAMRLKINLGIPPEVQIRDTQGEWHTFGCYDRASFLHDEMATVRFEHTFAAGTSFATDGANRIIEWDCEGSRTMAADGADNLRITYALYKNYPEGLTGSTAMGVFGADGADNVLFLGGSSLAPGTDAFSAAGDFTLFYDTSTEVLGSNATPITGYCRLSDGRMAVLKNDPMGANVYFRRHATVELGTTRSGAAYQVDLYPSACGAAVEGCLSAQTVGTVGNEPIFLTQSGLYAVKSVSDTLVNLNQTVRRSGAVDGYLEQVARETLLSVCWKSYYLLCFGQEALITDGKRDNAGNLRFLRWKFSHPVTALSRDADSLWLGDRNGVVYCMDAAPDDAGVVFDAFWQAALPEEASGNRMNLRQLWLSFSPDYRGEAEVTLIHGRCPGAPCRLPLHRLDFGALDFAAVSFDGSNQPRWVPLPQRGASADSFSIRIELKDGEALQLCGLRMMYEKGGRMV